MIRKALEILEKRYVNNDFTSKEWELASKGFLPLTPSIMKNFETPIKKAYHITDLEGLEMLKKLQNQKKQIPCFTKGSEGISGGARTMGQYMVELSGISSFESPSDISSELSRNGYRWLPPMTDNGSYVIDDLFSSKIKKKMVKYFNIKGDDEWGIEPELQIGNIVYDLDGKGKAKFIKWYFDEAKKLITKAFITKIKKSIGNAQGDMWNNNELFVHSIKILNVKTIVPPYDAPEEELYTIRKGRIEKVGVKYGGYILQNDIHTIGK